MAEEAVRERDNIRAVELYRLAGEAETLALEALEPTKTRTIGITAVSAASLLYDLNHDKNKYADLYLNNCHDILEVELRKNSAPEKIKPSKRFYTNSCRSGG